MNTSLQEYDVVRVKKLILPARDFEGTRSVSRPPKVGDEATICLIYNADDPNVMMAVEMVDKDGLTIWLADFVADELELVSRP